MGRDLKELGGKAVPTSRGTGRIGPVPRLVGTVLPPTSDLDPPLFLIKHYNIKLHVKLTQLWHKVTVNIILLRVA